MRKLIVSSALLSALLVFSSMGYAACWTKIVNERVGHHRYVRKVVRVCSPHHRHWRPHPRPMPRPFPPFYPHPRPMPRPMPPHHHGHHGHFRIVIFGHAH
ncbi:MAG: hypothetical protein ABIH77_01620 [Pseudomonadota bacterium]|nr:hypothetical protein [Gammaproteobacteria bacterium]MBU2546014.1 hypothetical protein [Gammaproteobacteria bacterium]